MGFRRARLVPADARKGIKESIRTILLNSKIRKYCFFFQLEANIKTDFRNIFTPFNILTRNNWKIGEPLFLMYACKVFPNWSQKQ